ncbi:MAG: SM-20-related protein [Alphaproteobacteria bacterium]
MNQNRPTTNKNYAAIILSLPHHHALQGNDTSSDALFEAIAGDLAKDGYSIRINALPLALTDILHSHLVNMPQHKFNEASVGRKSDKQVNAQVRNDEIVWIYDDSPAGKQWLEWTQALQRHLNRQLFMGLFSFESHFAHYAKGNYYKKHFDAFKGQANRMLSLVAYLNPDWKDTDGGELVVYTQGGSTQSIKVLPKYGTLVIFLSEEFEHEVQPPLRDRYSIAGWFRVNTSSNERIDPLL